MPYKKIAFFTAVVVLLVTINNLAQSIYSIWQKQDLIVKAQKELDQQKKENKKLKQEISTVNQPEFIETEARDQLALAKPGEKVVDLPNSATQPNKPTPTPIVDTRANWQKWWDVFFQ